MSVDAVARVVQGWMDGKSISALAEDFPGDDSMSKTRKAAVYLYSKVSQTISWGAHAYLRGWSLRRQRSEAELRPVDAMLPAFIQYGVRTSEAAVFRGCRRLSNECATPAG